MVYDTLSTIGIALGIFARAIGFSQFAALTELNPSLCGFLILFGTAILASLVFIYIKPARTRDPSRFEERLRFYQELYSVHRQYRLR